MSTAHSLQPLLFPLQGSRLIEASAGTGKTWTIAALYVRLVLGHGDEETGFGRPLLPPEILVVTFTEAATEELRGRIRQRLYEAARGFRGQGEVDAFLGELIAHYPPSQHGQCAYLLEAAADWMDEAAVYTIHGWCNRMLRRYAFDSGSLFEQEVAATDGELLDEVARDYWRTFFYPLDANAAEQVAALFESPVALLRAAGGLIRTPGMAGEGQAEQDLQGLIGRIADERRQRVTALKRPWAAWLDEIEVLLASAVADKVVAPAELKSNWRSNWISALRHWRDDPEALLPILNKGFERLTPEGLQGVTAPGKTPPSHPAFEAIAGLKAEVAALPELKPELLRHAAAWIRERFAQEKRRRARMDFDDLLHRLDDALQGEGGLRLAQVIRSQFPLALIDEFQDTDPVQYRIFQAVYGTGGNGQPSGLFLIGDPKQAIYGFRGADIHTYLAARRATEGRHYTLDRNFRSTGFLVEAVNRVFEHAESHAEGAFKFKAAEGENPLPFLPVEAQGRAEMLMLQGNAVPALTLWQLAAEGDAAISLSRYREQMAEALASEIVRLLNLANAGQAGFRRGEQWTPLKPADLAILVRTGAEAKIVRDALSARALRSVYLSDKDSVFASGEAADLLYWLQACAEPERDRCLRAALATATLALDYGELERLNHDELRWEEKVERFHLYRQSWRDQGVLPMLRRLLGDFDVPARLLRTTGGERSLTNLLHLAELLQTASGTLEGEQALIRYLSECIADGDNPEAEHVIRLESDADLLKVVTVHKSKGLEYPLVFLPFPCAFKEAGGEKRGFLLYHDDSGQMVVDLAPSEAAQAQADAERLQEDLRLLYVALTRAQHACWAGIAPVKFGQGKACQLHKSAMGYVLGGGEAMEAGDMASRLEALKGGCPSIRIEPPPAANLAPYRAPEQAHVLAMARTATVCVAEHWWIASYSALQQEVPGQGTPEPVSAAVPDAPDTPNQANLTEALEDEAIPAGLPTQPTDYTLHLFPRGPTPGTFLHGVLEWCARTGFETVAQDAACRDDVLTRRCRQRGWSAWSRPLADWLGRLLAAELQLPGTDDTFGLARLPRRAYQPEMEFWLEAEQVDTRGLDALVSRYTLEGQPRPKLLPDQLNGMLKGFIDLVFERGGRYYVADYKSNWLGADSGAYTRAAMQEVVLQKRYDLQYALYLLALHRQLKSRLGEGYDYDRQVGGAVYLFLRGIDGPARGLHLERPPRELIEALDDLFAGKRESSHVA